MANIGEPHSAKLARERLEAIKKYLPVRDSVKQQLQSRQESQVQFEEDTKQLFKSITETTKDIQPVLEKTAEATEKIAKRTKKTKQIPLLSFQDEEEEGEEESLLKKRSFRKNPDVNTRFLQDSNR